MKYKKIVLLMLFVTIVAVSVSSASAYHNSFLVNDTAQAKQAIEVDAQPDDEVIFNDVGNFTNFYTTVSIDNLTIKSLGAPIYGDGQHNLFTISGTSGFSMAYLNIQYIGVNCSAVSGSNVKNAFFYLNKFANGGDGINLFMTYENITIVENSFYNMTSLHGDGISLVDHTVGKNMSSWIGSTITGNKMDNVVVGIFLGGNFKGTISDNQINSTNVSIQFQGKQSSSNGHVNATITGNTLYSDNIGLALETPYYDYLYLDSNTIEGRNACVEVGSLVNNSTVLNPFIVTNNNFVGLEGDLGQFFDLSAQNLWSGNTLNGNPYPDV